MAVFCGSSTGNDPVFSEAARRVGATLAARNIRLVYGAGNVGLMGVLADAVLEAGGQVHGVIPEFLKAYEVCHDGLSELTVTQTMHERKQIMADTADAFIVLPGGFGTLDEFFEILTWRQLHLHNKPIGVLNVDGFYDALETHVRHLVGTGFIRPENLDLYCTASDIDTLLSKMTERRQGAVDKWA